MYGRTGRTFAAFASGAALAAIATRLLPPIAAQFAGARRGSAGGDPFEVLAEDHRIILKMLDGMWEVSRFNRLQMLLRLKRRLAAHAMAEEDVVYPLLHEQEFTEHAAKLYAEHGEMKILLHRLEHTATEDAGWREGVRSLRQLIDLHAHQEEEEEFPRLRERLDDKARTRLFGEILREKSLIL